MTEDQNTLTNILLVEDNETDVKILLKGFYKEQFQANLQNVEDGEQALEYVQNQGQYADQSQFPRPDVILLDINMPKMDGHTFVRELKALNNFNNIPIIVFTTKEGMRDIFQIEGVNHYINKSNDASELISLIKSVLNTPA